MSSTTSTNLPETSLDWHHVHRLFREAKAKVTADATYLDSQVAIATVLAMCRHEFTPTFPRHFFDEIAFLHRVAVFLQIAEHRVVEWIFCRREMLPTLRTYCVFDTPDEFILLVDDFYHQMNFVKSRYPAQQDDPLLFLNFYLRFATQYLAAHPSPHFLQSFESPENIVR